MVFRSLVGGAIGLLGLAMPLAAPAQTPLGYADGAQTLFTVELPDFWIARSSGPRVFDDADLGPLELSRVIAFEPETSRDAWIGMTSPEGISTLDEAQAYVANLGQFLLDSSEPGARFTARYGGLPAQVINGTGTREGRPLRYSVVLADLPGDRVAVIVALAAYDAAPGVVDEIRGVVTSLRAGR